MSDDHHDDPTTLQDTARFLALFLLYVEQHKRDVEAREKQATAAAAVAETWTALARVLVLIIGVGTVLTAGTSVARMMLDAWQGG